MDPFEIDVDGRTVKGRVHLPPGEGPHPGIVLAPGAGYHMDLPLVRGLCEALVEHGIAAVRFDYAVQAEGGEPTSERVKEREEVSAVLAFTRQLPGINAARLALGGKSLGSVLAWQAADDAVGPRVLLTPILRRAADAERLYPGLLRSTHPVLLVGGKADPLAAALPHVSMEASSMVTSLIVGGDHGLCDDPMDSRWAPDAIQLVVAWLRIHLQ